MIIIANNINTLNVLAVIWLFKFTATLKFIAFKFTATNSLLYPKTLFFRYQFFLQLKDDIYSGRLECPYDVAVEVFALTLQCGCHKCIRYIYIYI